MIYPFLFEDRQEGLVQLGIYAATSKIAMVMAMFTQAFRYAYEPFVFGKDREGDNRKMYAAAMKYFLIFSLLAFLAVMFYLDLLLLSGGKRILGRAGSSGCCDACRNM